MKLTKLSQKSSLIVLASVFYIADANAASWVRHIYNKTSAVWHFEIKSYSGNFYAHCTSNCKHGTDTYKNQNFTVEDGETWETKMTTTGGSHITNVGIVNQYGASAAYCFDNYSSQNGHMYADHYGKTGGISLNSPAGGDIKLNDPNSPPKGARPC